MLIPDTTSPQKFTIQVQVFTLGAATSVITHYIVVCGNEKLSASSTAHFFNLEQKAGAVSSYHFGHLHALFDYLGVDETQGDKDCYDEPTFALYTDPGLDTLLTDFSVVYFAF